MKILAALLLGATLTAVHAAETVAVGIGSSAESALANAKELAVGQVAGAFIVGRQWAEGEKHGSRVDEYNGGYLKRYEVIDTREDGGMIHVTIRAEVDTDKANERLESVGTEIPGNWAEELAKTNDEHERTGRIIAALDDRSQAFAVRVARVGYRNRGDLTDVDVDLELRWQPKWIDDVRALALVIGRKIDTNNSASGLLWAVAALSAVISPGLPGTIFSIARSAEKKAKPSDEYAACFGPNAWTDIDSCHEIRHPLPRVTRSRIVKISGSLSLDDRVIPLQEFTVDTESYLFRHVQRGREVYFSRGGYRTFSNPGILLFRDGLVRHSYRFALPTQELREVRRLNFSAS